MMRVHWKIDTQSLPLLDKQDVVVTFTSVVFADNTLASLFLVTQKQQQQHVIAFSDVFAMI